MCQFQTGRVPDADAYHHLINAPVEMLQLVRPIHIEVDIFRLLFLIQLRQEILISHWNETNSNSNSKSGKPNSNSDFNNY